MNAFANALFSLLLGWVRALVQGLWQLLSNGGAQRFFTWLGDHWIPLVGLLCLTGEAADKLIWLLRWRPDLVWRTKLRHFLARLRGQEMGERAQRTFYTGYRDAVALNQMDAAAPAPFDGSVQTAGWQSGAPMMNGENVPFSRSGADDAYGCRSNGAPVQTVPGDTGWQGGQHADAGSIGDGWQQNAIYANTQQDMAVPYAAFSPSAGTVYAGSENDMWPQENEGMTVGETMPAGHMQMSPAGGYRDGGAAAQNRAPDEEAFVWEEEMPEFASGTPAREERKRRGDRYARKNAFGRMRDRLLGNGEEEGMLDGLPPVVDKNEAFHAPVYPHKEQENAYGINERKRH